MRGVLLIEIIIILIIALIKVHINTVDVLQEIKSRQQKIKQQFEAYQKEKQIYQWDQSNAFLLCLDFSKQYFYQIPFNSLFLLFINQQFNRMNSSQGLVPIRMLKANQIQLLQKSFQMLKQKITSLNNQNIFWLNIYVDRKFITIVPDYQESLHSFVKDLLKEMFEQKIIPNSYGFLNNPKQNTKYQEWHIDYSRDMYTIFIPLVPFHTGNSVQYIRQNIKIDGMYGDEQNKKYHYYGKDDIKILQAQNILFYEVSQMVCRAFTVLKMLGGSVHRGVPNTTGMDRPTFWISCSGQQQTFNEEEFSYV